MQQADPPSSNATAVAERSGLDRYFKITERGSTVAREIRGGLVTFFSMCYIVVLNPLIIGTVPDSTGMYLGGGTEPNLPAVAAGTALIAGLLSVFMGAWAKFPLALAAGLGLNAYLAYSVAPLPGKIGRASCRERAQLWGAGAAAAGARADTGAECDDREAPRWS